MNKRQLAVELARRCNLSVKESERILSEIGSIINEELANGGNLFFKKELKLRLVYKAASTRRNPRNGEIVAVKARSVIKFTPSPHWLNLIKNGD